MKIDRKTILATAKLASLKIADSEIDKYHSEFNNILSYIEKLNELDIGNVKPTSHGLEAGTPLRKDSPGECLDRSKAVSNSPSDKSAGAKYFKVPKFIE